MRIGLDTAPTGKSIAHRDHCTPFGEARAHSRIILEAIAQSIQSFGDPFSRTPRQILRANIDFNARNDARVEDQIYKRLSIFPMLTDCLVVEDDAVDAIG